MAYRGLSKSADDIDVLLRQLEQFGCGQVQTNLGAKIFVKKAPEDITDDALSQVGINREDYAHAYQTERADAMYHKLLKKLEGTSSQDSSSKEGCSQDSNKSQDA